MNNTTARVSMATSKNPGMAAVEIRADRKSDAQAAIRLARAWLSANGHGSKLVSFTSSVSQYSNLVTYYSARVAFRATAVAS